MKISEQARRAAHRCRMRPEANHPVMIQEAIDNHERDLVEAAEAVIRVHDHLVTTQAVIAHSMLKAALDRRRE